tara:strand:- start:673 stop:1665 length:993 start_codon:yes stop_codon:yes gene_type:complete
MIFKNKIIHFLLFSFFILNLPSSKAENHNFNEWLVSYKEFAFKEGISKKTLNDSFKNVKFLEKVIIYDRRQPEFFEDTRTYVEKRASKLRIKNAKKILKNNEKLFDEVEKRFKVEKELLAALWGVETNFGKHVGKMDIISSLATLSFDKRRSKFFSNQLLILLKLIDKKMIKIETLYGSWAGAYGNFQFMPSTIQNYAIDYDKNGKLELKKSIEDSVASAANYMNRIGWKENNPCFYEIKLTKKIDEKYVNTSARNISNYQSSRKWKKLGLINYDGTELENFKKAALIMPDGNENSPAFLIFNNYEKILNWNRSLRFAITICTLKNFIEK